MKIIQVCPRFFPDIGGIETHVYEISKRLAKGNEIYVFTTDPSGKLPSKEMIDGIIIKRFKSFAPNESYFFSYELYSALKKESCDILHVHSFQAFTSFLAFLATDRKKIRKFIFTPHYHPKGGSLFRTILRKFYDPIQKKNFLMADKIIYLSRYEKNFLQKKIKIPSKKLIYIPNGLNLKELEAIKKPKRKFDFEILYVGRLEKYKRIHKIIFIFKNLVKKYSYKNIHFTIVGNGPYMEQLMKLTKNLNLEKKVSFEQNLPREDLIKRYKRADVFVMPSEYEAFCITVFEALACNTPVIASQTFVFKEFRNKLNGFFVANIKQFENILESLLKNKPNIKNNLENYNWDNIAEKIKTLYMSDVK